MGIISAFIGTVSLGVGILIMILLFKPLFTNWDGFSECLKLSFIPDIIALFHKQYMKSEWAEWKIGIWLLLSTIGGWFTFSLLSTIFGITH